MNLVSNNNPSDIQKAALNLDWATISFFAFIHLGVLAVFLPGTFSWEAVGITLFLHWFTGGLGITLGFHRLITHRSFQVPKWLEYFLAFCGTLTCQGGVIRWVGLHRIHHLQADTVKDPHDSHRGFWWSHIGWMLCEIEADNDIPKYTKDIAGDPVYQFLQKYFLPIQIVLAIALFVAGGLPALVWGIFVRLVIVFHCTWLVNSATHVFGYRTYETSDNSTNCWWVALLTYGEGWHNNHHAFQHSARHGLKWWEIDLTWMTVALLQKLRLASQVKLANLAER